MGYIICLILLFKQMRDKVIYHRVVQRIRRMEIGNLGDVKSVGDKVSEARIFANPEIRIYFTV